VSNKIFAVAVVLVLAGAFGADRFEGAARSTAARERSYPKPGYVSYETELTDEQLMFLARRQARQTESRNGRLGVIEPGKKGLLVINAERQDMKVIEACIRALRERGADAGYISTGDLLEMYGHPKEWAKHVQEFDPMTQADMQLLVQGIEKYKFSESNFTKANWEKLPKGAPEIVVEERRRYRLKNELLGKYLDSHPEYDYVFIEWFSGGPMVQEMSDLFGRKFHLGWRTASISSLISEGSIPKEVWRALEQKVLETIPWIRHVRVTDPEGTDVEFSINKEDAYYWRIGAFLVDYIRMYPMQAGRWLYRSLGVKYVVVPEATGVIAGTVGHYNGIIPRLELKIEKGQVVKVQGGGLQGLLMDDIREKYKDIHLPMLPHPGWLNVFHLSMPVNPKDGARSVTWAFGSELYIPEIEEYGRKHNVPITHDFHLGNLFPTYVATVTGGKKVTIIDKGHLTVLDDPEVRAIASKYGDPDDILREEGADPIPGINAPGDYQEYAQNPMVYWAKQRDERRAGTSPYLEKILPMQLQAVAEQHEARNRMNQ